MSSFLIGLAGLAGDLGVVRFAIAVWTTSIMVLHCAMLEHVLESISGSYFKSFFRAKSDSLCFSHAGPSGFWGSCKGLRICGWVEYLLTSADIFISEE